MPDGSTYPGEARQPPDARAGATEAGAAPKLPHSAPVSRARAEELHKQSRKIGFFVAHGVELAGVIALGATGEVGWAVFATVAYAQLAQHNYRANHRTHKTQWESHDITCYHDMVRNYGTGLEDNQTANNFIPYNPARQAWTYRVGGLWCGLTSRSVVPCLVRSVPTTIKKITAWRPPTRRDPLRPSRREERRKP